MYYSSDCLFFALVKDCFLLRASHKLVHRKTLPFSSTQSPAATNKHEQVAADGLVDPDLLFWVLVPDLHPVPTVHEV